MNNEALIVSNLKKKYDNTTIIDRVDLYVKKGQCYGLLGPNGAGKTTLLRTILGLTKFQDGTVNVLGFSIPDQADVARFKIGVVPQFDNLDPDFTVLENLLVFGKYFGLRHHEIKERIPELLKFVALSSKSDKKINELSGGMKRRLTIARALINDPDLIIMDEPTTGLDPQTRHLIWERLKDIVSKGKTVLLTTHFMDEAQRLCNRLAVIDHGKIIAEGVPDELVASYVEPYIIEAYGEDLNKWIIINKKYFLNSRIEINGGTAFCYTHDAGLFSKLINHDQNVRILQRFSNLEDMFLKLTGRDMRDSE